MTELWTTFMLTLAVAAAFRAYRSGATRDYLLAGVLFGVTALEPPGLRPAALRAWRAWASCIALAAEGSSPRQPFDRGRG